MRENGNFITAGKYKKHPPKKAIFKNSVVHTPTRKNVVLYSGEGEIGNSSGSCIGVTAKTGISDTNVGGFREVMEERV